MFTRRLLLGGTAALAACTGGNPTPPPSAQTWTLNGQQTAITFSAQYGAAITSLKFAGVEFVDTKDYGREIQTAYQLNGQGEGYNPTEAGQAAAPPTPSNTQIISTNLAGLVFSSSVHPAFWNAVNRQLTSPDTIAKTVTLDYNGIVNLVRHDVTVTTAMDYQVNVLAGLTGYLTSAFPNLYTYQNGVLTPQKAGQTPDTALSTNLPVVLSSGDGATMGVYSSVGTYAVMLNIGGSGTNNWTAAWRPIHPCPKGVYGYTVYYVVGSLADVTSKMAQVIQL